MTGAEKGGFRLRPILDGDLDQHHSHGQRIVVDPADGQHNWEVRPAQQKSRGISRGYW
jgi:hypothetical protein